MLDKIKRLGADTAIYGISTILGRFLNFLLVPFYTHVLPPDKYGIVAYVYSIVAFVTVLYSYGMESAYFKYASSKEIGSEKQNFSTPFLSLTVSSLAFTCVILFCRTPILGAMNITADYGTALTLVAWTMAFDAMAIIPFASLRLERKAKTFAAFKVANIVINVVLNIVLLLKFKMGVEGIFISGVVASGATLVLLLPTIFRHFTPVFPDGLLKALLKFGTPYIPAGLAAMAIQVIDRPIMRALTDDTTVGIYQANYKLGIFMMLVVSMFDFAWRPFYFSISEDPDAKPVFARVLTYMMLVMAAFFLVISLFIHDIVTFKILGRHFIAPDYWSGIGVVPVVLLGYVFLGASNNLSAGIFIQKKTYLIPFVTGIGAVVNIAVNYMLIPRIGMMGGAWATFFAYFIMAGAMFAVAQRIYPVQYEYGRIFKMAAVTAGIFLADYYFGTMGGVLMKVGLLVLFVVLMYAMKFFNEAELLMLTKMFTRRKPAQVPVSIPPTSPEVDG